MILAFAAGVPAGRSFLGLSAGVSASGQGEFEGMLSRWSASPGSPGLMLAPLATMPAVAGVASAPRGAARRPHRAARASRCSASPGSPGLMLAPRATGRSAPCRGREPHYPALALSPRMVCRWGPPSSVSRYAQPKVGPRRAGTERLVATLPSRSHLLTRGGGFNLRMWDVTHYTLRKCLIFLGCDGVTSFLQYERHAASNSIR